MSAERYEWLLAGTLALFIFGAAVVGEILGVWSTL